MKALFITIPFIIVGLAQTSFAGLPSGFSTIPCNSLEDTVMTEKRIELPENQGAVLLQLRYSATDCTPRGGGYSEGVRAVIVQTKLRPKSPARNFVLLGTEMIGNIYAGGSVNKVALSSSMAGYCKLEGKEHYCSVANLGGRKAEGKSDLGLLKKNLYGFSIAGDGIPFTMVGTTMTGFVSSNSCVK